jgi:hypothetical protein
MSSGMLVMIAAYIVVGYYKFHNVGNGAIEYGNFGYPKTGFLPFGSTVGIPRGTDSYFTASACSSTPLLVNPDPACLWLESIRSGL